MPIRLDLIGKRLLTAHTRRDLSANQVAQRTGIQVVEITPIEKGTRPTAANVFENLPRH